MSVFVKEIKEGGCPKCGSSNTVDDSMFYGCLDCGWSNLGTY